MSDQSISTVSLSSDDGTIQTITLTASDQSWQTGTISSSNTFPSNNKHCSMHATGDVRIDGDLKIQGESIKDLLEEINLEGTGYEPADIDDLLALIEEQSTTAWQVTNEQGHQENVQRQ
jgi:hypothetical protein